MEPDVEHGQRRVALSHIGEWEISTVFLATDHNFLGGGSPILWELRVFGPEPWGEYQERFTSRADAKVGHKRICDLILAGKLPPEVSEL